MWPIRAAWLVVAAGSVAQATLQIIPGATWTATNTGKHVQAHGAGITQVGSTYYMIGEDKTDGSAFQNINCYSSTNLVEWAFEGALLSRTSAAGDLGPNRVVERPKVVFNAAANRYVMYLHIDSSNYGDAKVGVATSDTVCGKYTYLRSFRPLGFESRDIGLFKDDDGAAYLLTEDRPNGLRIDALSNDYLDVTRNVFLWNENIESPAILKKNGYYFMFGSRLTGWDANDNVYSYATSLAGPWSSWRTFAPAGSKTFQSQTSFVLPLGDTAVYMGDRWVPDNLMRSTYVWLPLTIAGTTVSMTNRVNWTPNVAQGTWAPGPAETTPEAETGVLAGGARTLSCSGCSGGTAVGYLGGPSGGVVTINGISSQASTRSTIRIKHANGDRAQRFARVAVNGGAPQTLAFLPSDDGNAPATSVLHAALNQGAANTIEIRGLGDGSYGPDVDRLMVPNN